MIGRLRAAFAPDRSAAWFFVIDLLWIARPEVLGIDARHYQRAASAWLSGGDPWKVTENGIPFAAGPHTLLFYAPTSLLPLEVSMALWMVLGVAAAVWMVRRLRVARSGGSRSPLAHALWNGNPQSIVLALLVAGGTIPAIVAVGLKLYAAIPLVVRPRQLILVAVALAITLPLLPWQLYIADGFGVTSHLASAWNGSAWRMPILIPPTLLGLWILRRQGCRMVRGPGRLAGHAVLLRLDGDAGRHRPAARGRGARPARAADDAGARHGPRRRRGTPVGSRPACWRGAGVRGPHTKEQPTDRRSANAPREIPVVILAGGLGTRLREETDFRPKPMVEVGGRPILWHIMKIYDHFGHRRFVLPVGYLGDMIKDYFLSYADRHADFTVDTLSGALQRHDSPPESWSVTVVDTGLDTMTGGRVRRLRDHLPGRFMLTYGDGVADIPIDRLLAFHEAHGRLATVTAVRPPSRFGALGLDGDSVVDFSEKPQAEAGWINGGFFIFEHAGARLPRRRRHRPGARAPGGARPGRAADGLPAPRLLGTDGHRAGPEQPGQPVGRRHGAMEGLG